MLPALAISSFTTMPTVPVIEKRYNTPPLVHEWPKYWRVPLSKEKTNVSCGLLVPSTTYLTTIMKIRLYVIIIDKIDEIVGLTSWLAGFLPAFQLFLLRRITVI